MQGGERTAGTQEMAAFFAKAISAKVEMAERAEVRGGKEGFQAVRTEIAALEVQGVDRMEERGGG